MKTDNFPVSSDPVIIDQAMNQIERAADYCGLGGAEGMALRQLAEESILMTMDVLDKAPGELWMENEGKNYELHLRVKTDVSFDAREEFISVSKAKRNTQPKGLKAKLGNLFTEIFSANVSGESFPYLYGGVAYGLMGEFYVPSDQSWSLSAYQEKNPEEKEQEEQDAEILEAQKSLIEKLADDVVVTVTSNSVELIVRKAF